MHPYVIIQGSQLWLATIRFVGEGEEKDLQKGGGVVM